MLPIKMKFLLAALNAKYIHSNPAVYSLRAYVDERLKPNVEIAEYTINNQMDKILYDIYVRKPDVIGFSCYIWNINMILDLATELHKLMPGLPIWLGGPEVSYDALKLMEAYPFLAGIMIGEGEVTFQELLQYYVDLGKDGEGAGRKLADIAGLCLPGGYTAVRELTDLNHLPFLYGDLEGFSDRIIYYESSRGCPYRCSYCLSSIDKKVRLRDIAIVRKELKFFLDHKVKQVKFIDRTFNCIHKHAVEIWEYLLEHDNGVTNFHFEIAADIMTDEEISLLSQMRPGLIQLEIGVQTVNPVTLKAIHRHMDLVRLKQTVQSLRAGKNIHLHLDLIAGLPYEDYTSFRKSFNEVYAMTPEELQLGFLKVLKGSEMQEKAPEYGIYYFEKPPYEVLYTKWLSYGEVRKLKKVEEVLTLYYNSGQYTHTLPFLQTAFDSPFSMFEAMAAFFEDKGYFINSPARAYRYQILLAFAMQWDEAYTAVYKELLLFDLYLRENLKSRPEFAQDSSIYKMDIRDIYAREEKERSLLPDYSGYDARQLGKMTHIEPFTYPVWELAEEEKALQFKSSGRHREEALYYVMFDYRNRNCLNHEAHTIILSQDEKFN